MRALADAEQELHFTRLQVAEFQGFLVSLGNVDETVQRGHGVLVIDAKEIYDSMYGASEPRAMEEKRTAIEMIGIQELRFHGGVTEKRTSDDGLTKETATTQLERFCGDGR